MRRSKLLFFTFEVILHQPIRTYGTISKLITHFNVDKELLKNFEKIEESFANILELVFSEFEFEINSVNFIA